jgi:hypothetical protein
MNRILGTAALVLGSVLLLGPVAAPALAQTAPPPGSTINGSVPHAEGNVWNGLDHQPTLAGTVPIHTHRQAQVNHTLGTLDRQLLGDPLPKIPAGAPQVGSK